MSLINFNKNKQTETVKEKFDKIKLKINKYYPEAKTGKDIFSKYYVMDKNGHRILPDDSCMPNTKTVFEAWEVTLKYMTTNKIVNTNTEQFNYNSNKGSIISNILMQQ